MCRGLYEKTAKNVCENQVFEIRNPFDPFDTSCLVSCCLCRCPVGRQGDEQQRYATALCQAGRYADVGFPASYAARDFGVVVLTGKTIFCSISYALGFAMESLDGYCQRLCESLRN